VVKAAPDNDVSATAGNDATTTAIDESRDRLTVAKSHLRLSLTSIESMQPVLDDVFLENNPGQKRSIVSPRDNDGRQE